jgi:hypothetical protein
VGCTPRTGGRRPVAVVGVSGPAVDNAEGKVAEGGGEVLDVEREGLRPSREDEMTVLERGEDISLPCAKIMDGGRPWFLLKNLPNIFLAPEGGMFGLRRDGSVTGDVELLGCCERSPDEETDTGVSGLIDGDPGVGGRTLKSFSLCEYTLPSTLVRALAAAMIGASPQTSMGSSMASPMTSKPRF